jgi:spermidine/putrescine transport system ATP-binding protein
VYERPISSFVAQFVGRTNLFPARIAELGDDATVIDANGTKLTALRPAWAEIGMAVDAAVRPEWLSLSIAGREASAAENIVDGTVAASRFAGSTLNIDVETTRIGRLSVEARSGHPALRKGTAVSIAWPKEKNILLRKQHKDG